jgi:hypothetical protein
MHYIWHFSDGKLNYGDNRDITQGMALACNPDDIALCSYGFHGSYKLLDTLHYANGTILSLCEIGGRIIEGDDKVVTSQRRHLAVANIERTLHEFAIRCAEDSLASVEKPDPRSLRALEVKRLWLEGNATKAELSAATAEAMSAARSAAWYAARSAQNEILTDAVMALPEFSGFFLTV